MGTALATRLALSAIAWKSHARFIDIV